MGETFGGYCDGCRCGFSLTKSLQFWPKDGDLLLCTSCTDTARHLGRKRANAMIREYGEFVDVEVEDIPVFDRGRS